MNLFFNFRWTGTGTKEDIRELDQLVFVEGERTRILISKFKLVKNLSDVI